MGAFTDFSPVAPDDQPAFNPLTGMAAMVIGPVFADPETRDSVRDAIAEMIMGEGVVAVGIFRGKDVLSPKITVTPTEVVEIFMSRLAAEMGIETPGYLTLADALG